MSLLKLSCGGRTIGESSVIIAPYLILVVRFIPHDQRDILLLVEDKVMTWDERNILIRVGRLSPPVRPPSETW